MTTTKLSSEKSRFFSVYKATLRHQFAFQIIVAILSFLCIPLVFIVELLDSQGDLVRMMRYSDLFYSGVYMNEGQPVLILVLLAVLTVVLALFANAYLHSKKTVDLYHSLPVTRPSLLSANLLASMTTVFLPFLAVYFLTLLAEIIICGSFLAMPGLMLQYIFFDLLTIILYVLVIYLFIMFIAVNVGTILDSFAISGALAFTPMLVYSISGYVWASLTYGADFSPENHILLLSPFTFIFQRYMYMSWSNRNWAQYEAGNMVGLILFSLAVAAVLFFASVFCYKRRKSEIAEQTQVGGIFQTIVKCAAAFCGAAFFYAIFYQAGIVIQIIMIMIGSVIIGLIAELVLSRGPRSIGKNIIWLAGTGILCALMIIILRFDIFPGLYTQRVPSPDRVQGVYISYNGRFDELDSGRYWSPSGSQYLGSPESIEVVTQAHKLAVSDVPPSSGDFDRSRYQYSGFRLEYKLTNGRTMTRYYSRVNLEALTHLVNLEDKADFISTHSALFYMDNLEPDQIDLISRITFLNAVGEEAVLENFNGLELQILLESMRADLLAESLDDIKYPPGRGLGAIKIDYYSRDKLNDMGLLQGLGVADVFRSYGNNETVFLLSEHHINTINALKSLDLYSCFTVPDMPDSAYVITSPYSGYDYYGFGNEGKIHTLGFYMRIDTPYNWKHVDEYYTDQWYLLGQFDDRETIDFFLNNTRNQIYLDDENRDEIVFVIFLTNWEMTGCQAIRLEDIPPEIRSNLKAGERSAL